MKPADLLTISAAMPDCRLVIVPGIGNSMNLEVPALYAGYFGAWFGPSERSFVTRGVRQWQISILPRMYARC